MAELAKWVWIVLIAFLFVGPWLFAIIALDVIAFVLIAWLKPEWLERF